LMDERIRISVKGEATKVVEGFRGLWGWFLGINIYWDGSPPQSMDERIRIGVEEKAIWWAGFQGFLGWVLGINCPRAGPLPHWMDERTRICGGNKSMSWAGGFQGMRGFSEVGPGFRVVNNP
jgi:hypothetical protein